MNGYAVLILVALLVEYVLTMVADIFNLRALRPVPPQALSGVYEATAYQKSQAYTRIQTQFGWVKTTLMLAVTLLFWFAGGLQALDTIIRAWDMGPVGSGLAYIGILLLGQTFLALPFRLYATFVLEERFGFNKTTPATFLADMAKGGALAVALGGALLAGVLAFFQYAGAYAWFYCWLATTLFGISLQYIAPTWIMPLFNRFQPLPAGPLKEALLAYARRIRFSLADVFVIDGSRRSTKSNAFFTGFGRRKRIALFDTLIEQLSVAELVAVLAHEVGHYKRKHIVQRLLLGIAHTGMLFFLLSQFVSRPGLFQAFYVEQPSVYVGLVCFGLLYTPVELVLSCAMGWFSRKHEYEADCFAVETLETPEAMVQALQKLSAENLSNLTPHPFYVALHYSHPPVLARMRAIHQAIALRSAPIP